MYGNEAPLVVGLVALGLALLPIILLARISHWAFQTQRHLEETNRLLKALAKAQGIEEQKQPATEPTFNPGV